MSIQVSIEGTDKIIARLNGMSSAADKAAPRAIFRQAQKTLTKAIHYCPLETGSLRASGKVELVGTAVEISFGGPTAPYAPFVHEILHYNHPVGQAKFLEQAVQEDANAFAAAIAKDMQQS